MVVMAITTIALAVTMRMSTKTEDTMMTTEEPTGMPTMDRAKRRDTTKGDLILD
jgi:hypothetical protein